MEKPKLFIGAASENRFVVDALETELRSVAQIRRWDLDTFRPGHFTLDELNREAADVDFAIFVLGMEDLTVSRERLIPSPRDNVIFEAGLFTATLGHQRTFYVVDKQGTKLPTDWAGLGYLTFDSSDTRPRDIVFEAVAKIREQIEHWKPFRAQEPSSFSTSNRSDLKTTYVKAAQYVRATAEELAVLDGDLRDKRAALVNQKLIERNELDV